MSGSCPVCKLTLNSKIDFPSGKDAKDFSCPRCGDFTLSGTLSSTLPDILAKNHNADVKISHSLRMMQRVNQNVELSEYTIQPILENSLPRPKEQADLLIRWLAENSDSPGQTFSFKPLENYLSIIGTKIESGLILIISHLSKIGLVTAIIKELRGSLTGNHIYVNDLSLSFDGWEYYETLLKGKANYRKAFMAMKFGDSELNQVLENVFKPSVKMTGFDLFKLDDEPRAGLIDDRLRVEIQSSDFLIADLSHDNLGAYWEAGYAEGLGKPVIYTCEKQKFDSEKSHFDTNHHLTVIWDKNSPEQAGEQLKATIRATLPHLAKLND